MKTTCSLHSSHLSHAMIVMVNGQPERVLEGLAESSCVSATAAKELANRLGLMSGGL